MEQVFHPIPRSTVVPVRPKPVEFLDKIKIVHSSTLNRHDYRTCDKFGPRDRSILKQRAIGYPVCVPDLSLEATQETLMRRSIHKELLNIDEKAFRKKFYPECTADVFHQKHLVRDYLATMHPYSDPLDHGRTYNQSRLKSREYLASRGAESGRQSREGGANGGLEDFLQPDDPTRPRSTGYSRGHIRNMLKLNTYGEKGSEDARIQREMGLLPPSPNTDRYRTSSPGSASNSSAGSSSAPSRRPRTTGHMQTDSIDVYLPLPQHGRTSAFPESESFTVLFASDHEQQVPHSRIHSASRAVKVPPGTLGYVGPAITKEDITLVDPHSRGVEYFQGIMTRKQQKLKKSQSKLEEAKRLKGLRVEAMNAMEHISQFEQNLKEVFSRPRPL